MKQEIHWESKALLMERMSWQAIEERIRTGTDVVLLPLGSTEQHGPNGSVTMDSGRAAVFARLLSERLHPKALVAPVMPFGLSAHHMAFAGTITLSATTYAAVLKEVVGSLYHHGLRKFFCINGHGGNESALDLAGRELFNDLGDIRFGWSTFTQLASDTITQRVGTQEWGHACQVEVSEAMYLAPWTVQNERRAGEPVASPVGQNRSPHIHEAYAFEERTRNGAMGDARQARWDFGRDVVEDALSQLVDFLQNY